MTEWNILQAKQKEAERKILEAYDLTDSKCVKLAEDIARNKRDCLPYEHLEKELTTEISIMKMKTRIFNNRNQARIN